MERPNRVADLSRDGIRQRAGIRVNRLCRLADIERAREAIGERGRITASQAARSCS